MANEIHISATTGLTVSIQLYNSIAVGTPFSATEIGTSGEYFANMPSVPYGRYVAVATEGSNKIGAGEIFWDGFYEINESLATIQGLNPNSPSTTTQALWTAGNININITGDGETSTTMTRT